MRVDFKKTFLLFLTFLMILVTTELNYAESASDPYTVPTTVRNNWNNTVGGKNFDMRTGRNLVYDIYSNKYINGGYRITNRDFGKGTQPYLQFSGWAVNFGHKRHTSSNHDTYIVARQNGNSSNTKIYSTIPINISATKDLEYNNQGGTGVWNECSSSATNKSNIPEQDNGCNMRYDNVGFHAYLPLNELFPDQSKGVTYSLFIVKKVDSHIVYSPLVLPFDFDNRSFNGGEIHLSSGINANKLTMRSYPVIRRTQARQSGVSGTTLGYFEQFRQYTRVNADESGTTVWYGVRSPHDSNNTRWASTAYWNFDGDQAVISFTPDSTPPEHREHGITNHRYKNGNDYWVQPNDKVDIRLRGYDLDTYLERTALQLSGSALARVRHIYGTSTSGYDYYTSSSHIDVFSGRRTYQSTNQRLKEATFQIAPKTHGHSYDISAYHRDHANNNSGWVNTNMKLRVDGVKPVHISQNINGEKYRDGTNYWIRPDDIVQVAIRGRDLDSGLNNTMISLGSSNNRVTGKHDFSGTTTNLTRPINTTSEMTIVSANRTYTSGNIREVTFNVRGNTHGASHAVRHRYEDNVNNVSDGDNSGWSDFDKYIKVDGKAPEHIEEVITGHRYKNGNDYWIKTNDTVKVALRGRDLDSGLKQTELSTGSGTNRNIIRHLWSGNSWNYTQSHYSSEISFESLERTYSSGNIREVTYTLRGNRDGAEHGIRHRYVDNVDNVSEGDSNGWSNTINTVKVDGKAPTISFSQMNTGRLVNINIEDEGSGVKRWRYSISQNGGFSFNTWSDWIEGSSGTVQIPEEHGNTLIRVEAEDNVGNIGRANSEYITFTNLTAIDMEFYDLDNNLVSHLKKNHPYKVKVTFKNTGETNVNMPFKVGFYEGWDLIEEKQAEPIGINQTQSMYFDITPTTPNFKYFKFKVDSQNEIREKDEWDNEVEKNIYVNTPPTITIDHSPSVVYEGDNFFINMYPRDENNHPLKVTLEMKDDSNQWIKVYEREDVWSGSMLSHRINNAIYKKYEFRATVEDSYKDKEIVSYSLTIQPLVIQGFIDHTEEWQKIHEELGNQEGQFYSGEKFLVSSVVTEHPIEYVQVQFKGIQVDGSELSIERNLFPVRHPLYSGEIYDRKMSDPNTRLANGTVYFVFTAKWLNGTVKSEVVSVQIIDDVYKAFDFHRTN